MEYKNRYQEWLDFEELQPELREELEQIKDKENIILKMQMQLLEFNTLKKKVVKI